MTMTMKRADGVLLHHWFYHLAAGMLIEKIKVQLINARDRNGTV